MKPHCIEEGALLLKKIRIIRSIEGGEEIESETLKYEQALQKNTMTIPMKGKLSSIMNLKGLYRSCRRDKKAAEAGKYAESFVATPTGAKPICDIRAGDQVISLDEDDRETIAAVKAIVCKDIARIVQVVFDDGAIWRTTADQQVYCGGGKKQGITEETGSEVLTKMGGYTGIVRAVPLGERTTVYGLVVEGTNIIFVNDVAAVGYSEEQE